MAIRKSVASLSAADRTAFVRAVKLLKQTPSQFTPHTPSRYDDYVYIHLQVMRNIHLIHPALQVDDTNWKPDRHPMREPMLAHQCSTFLPWHREFLYHFELDLQTASGDRNMGLPYWDWIADQQPNALPWTDDCMGGDGDATGKVQTGLFAVDQGWPLNITENSLWSSPSNIKYLARTFGRDRNAMRLPLKSELDDAMACTVYDQAPWDDAATSGFRNMLEGFLIRSGGTVGSGLHNLVHQWIGGEQGTMNTACSPNDPIFFLHHANIDRLWAQWQRMHPAVPHYLPANPVPGSPGISLHEPMTFYYRDLSSTPPWGGRAATPADVLDHRTLGYSYDTDTLPLPISIPTVDRFKYVRATTWPAKMKNEHHHGTMRMDE